jgi:hypothetical protein
LHLDKALCPDDDFLLPAIVIDVRATALVDECDVGIFEIASSRDYVVNDEEPVIVEDVGVDTVTQFGR